MATVCHLGFFKNDFLKLGVQFRESMSIIIQKFVAAEPLLSYGDLTIFFKMATIRHLGFLKTGICKCA